MNASFKRRIAAFVGLAAVVYIVGLAGIYFFQRSYLYFPSSTYVAPEEARISPRFRELSVTTEDAIALKGWYAPAIGKKATFVFFHGNAHDLRTSAYIADPYLADGHGFFLTEYRAYSGFPGYPTEAGLYADARAQIKALIAAGVREEDIILFGHSLGTGVAVQMATEFRVRGLILMAPFLSVVRMAQLRFPMFPVAYITKDRYDSENKISGIRTPLLIANGGKDWVVPPQQGWRLYELANDPKTFYFDPSGAHSNMFGTAFAKACISWEKALGKSS